MKCATCNQPVHPDNAAIDPRTGKAWHIGCYGAVEEIEQAANKQCAERPKHTRKV